MEEKTNNESEQKVEETNKVTEAESNAGNSQDRKHEVDVLSEAKKIQEDMKRENDRKQKLIEREEKLLARQETLKALGGGSPAGTATTPKVETPKEYADRILNGKANKL